MIRGKTNTCDSINYRGMDGGMMYEYHSHRSIRNLILIIWIYSSVAMVMINKYLVLLLEMVGFVGLKRAGVKKFAVAFNSAFFSIGCIVQL